MESYKNLGLGVPAPRKRCASNKPSQTQLFRNVFQRAKDRWENCGSIYALEIAHIVPQAKGGP